ncbi:hypothetical protein ACX0HA_09655 [Flavobacterium hauense]
MTVKFLSFLLLLSATLFLSHNFIADEFFKGEFYYQIWHIYAFLGIATLGILMIMNFIHKNFPDKTGFAFMGLSIFKIAASVIFFIPLMNAQVPNPVGDVLNFFVPYFIYLLVEVVFAVRLINSK